MFLATNYDVETGIKWQAVLIIVASESTQSLTKVSKAETKASLLYT